MNKPRSRFLIPGVTLAMVAVVAVGLGALANRRAKPTSPAVIEEPAPTAATPTAPPPPPPPSAPRSAATSAPHPSKAAVDSLNESVLMARLRSAGGRDAALAIVLARSGNRRFLDSPEAPERASILIHALASQGLSSEARGEAEYMVNHYPDSSWVREVEQFTGAHRHRNLRVNDAGVLEVVP